MSLVVQHDHAREVLLVSKLIGTTANGRRLFMDREHQLIEVAAGQEPPVYERITYDGLERLVDLAHTREGSS